MEKRGHVRDGAHCASGACEGFPGSECGICRILSHFGELGQPEVQDLRLPPRSDKYIGWFEVAMDDAFGMGGLECVGNLNGNV